MANLPARHPHKAARAGLATAVTLEQFANPFKVTYVQIIAGLVTQCGLSGGRGLLTGSHIAGFLGKAKHDGDCVRYYRQDFRSS